LFLTEKQVDFKQETSCFLTRNNLILTENQVDFKQKTTYFFDANRHFCGFEIKSWSQNWNLQNIERNRKTCKIFCDLFPFLQFFCVN